jgi:CHAT domain-containing protein/tetratricopeptide (TPR) repeat protein
MKSLRAFFVFFCCCTTLFLSAQQPDTARFESYKKEIQLIAVKLEENSSQPLPEETLKKMDEMQGYFQPIYARTGQGQFYLAAIHTFRGSDDGLKGRIEDSNTSYLKAIEVLSKPANVANDTSLADVHNLLSLNYTLLNDFSNSDRCLDYAQSIYKRLNMIQRVAMIDVNRSVSCAQRKRGQNARYFSERALRLFGELPQDPIVRFYTLGSKNALALAYRIIADSLVNTGNLNAAYEQYRDAAQLHQVVTDSLLSLGAMDQMVYFIHKSWYHQAYCLLQMGDKERRESIVVLEKLTQSIRERPQIGAPEEDALSFALLGTAYSKEGRFQEANTNHDKAENLLNIRMGTAGEPDISQVKAELKMAFANVLMQRAMSLQQEGMMTADTVLLRRAVGWGEKTIAQWEAIALAYDSGESDQSAGDVLSINTRWLSLAAAAAFEKTGQEKYKKTALYYCEKTKAYNLRYLTRQNMAGQQFKGVQGDIYSYHKDLQKRTRLAGNDMVLKTKYIKENEELIKKVSSSKDPDSLGYFVEVLDNRVLSADQMSNAVSSGKAVVQYLIRQEGLVVFVIKKNGSWLKKYPLPSDFEQQVERYVHSMRQQRLPNKTLYVSSAQALCSYLFPPEVRAQLSDVSDLTIVPDGILHTVPFACLLTEKTKTTDDYKKMPYLMRRFGVAYQYSMTTHQLVGQTTPVQESDLAIGAFIARYGASAKNESLQKMANEVSFLQQRHFPSKRSFVYKKATTAQIKVVSGIYDVLYFVMHGYANDRKDPLSYGLACSDSMLYVADMYDLSFRSQLAVFGSCNTAWGANGQGEGIYSIARVCIARGCRAVLAISNEVRGNDVAAPVIKRFFEVWRGSATPKGKAQALADAQMHYLNSCLSGDSYEHPAIWGNFILIGED